MFIEKFDINSAPSEHPLPVATQRERDVCSINDLLKLIGPTRTEFIEDDPELLRQTMLGLDYLVLRDPGVRHRSVVGVVSVADRTDEAEGLAEIKSLAVDTDYQGKGYGRMLANEALTLCVARQYSEVQVDVIGLSSRKTLAPMGFEVVEELDGERARLAKRL